MGWRQFSVRLWWHLVDQSLLLEHRRVTVNAAMQGGASSSMSRYYPEYYYFNTSASFRGTEHSEGNFSLTVNIGTCKTMFTIPSNKPWNDTVLFSGTNKTSVTVTVLCPAFAKEIPQDTNQLHVHQKLTRLLIDSCNTSCRVLYFQDEKYIGNVLKNKCFGAFKNYYFSTYYGILIYASLCDFYST